MHTCRVLSKRGWVPACLSRPVCTPGWSLWSAQLLCQLLALLALILETKPDKLRQGNAEASGALARLPPVPPGCAGRQTGLHCGASQGCRAGSIQLPLLPLPLLTSLHASATEAVERDGSRDSLVGLSGRWSEIRRRGVTRHHLLLPSPPTSHNVHKSSAAALARSRVAPNP